MMNFRTTPYHSVVMNEIYAYALKLLRIRDYTVSELRARLEAKFGAVPPELMEQLLQRKFVKPDWPSLAPLKVGVVGPHDAGHDAAFEVRAFSGRGGYEDPVTGSLNASLAQWVIGAGLAKSPYVAAQGTALQRAGRVRLRKTGEEVWVGGDVVDVVRGEINL